jgi:sulfite exporter TauE/SafE
MFENKIKFPLFLIISGVLLFSIGLNISYYNTILKLHKQKNKLNNIFDNLMKEIERQEILQENKDVRLI